MSCVRFYPNVLHSFCACHAFLSKCPVFDHACCLPPVRQTERLAICSVPIPPWVGIAIRAFSDVAWLSGFVGSFRACAFSGGDPDGERRRRGTRGTESAARQSAFLRDHIGFAVFSAGSTLGQKVEAALRPRPRLRQRAIGSLDSLHLIRGVGAFCAAKGTRGQRRLDRLAFVLRLSYVPIEMSCVRSRLLFAACAPNRTACDRLCFYSAVGRDRYSRVLGCRVVIGLCWFTSGLRVFWRRSRRRTKGTRRTESAARRKSAFA